MKEAQDEPARGDAAAKREIDVERTTVTTARTADEYVEITRRLVLPMDAARVLATVMAAGPVPQSAVTFGGKASDRRVAKAVERLVAEGLIETDVEDGGGKVLLPLPVERWENDSHFMHAAGVQWRPTAGSRPQREAEAAWARERERPA